MSLRVMTAVWDMDLPAKSKLVLLALADCANDEGLAWPSIATMARKCGCDERTIQRNLRDLENAKIVTRNEVKGKGCTYQFDPRQIATPGKKSPVTNRPKTPGKLPPKQSRTVIGLSNDKPKRVTCSKPDDVSDEIWRDFKAQRKKPVTDTALRGIKREADKAGWSLSDALEEATTRGWEGFKAQWVRPRQTNDNQRGGSLADIGNEVRQLFHGNP